MSPTTSILAFVAAAGLLTITPGLDTMLVVRTRLAAGRGAAFAAAIGVGVGCLVWGLAAALGLAAVLAAAPRAYTALRWCGAVYLLLCGLQQLLHPRRTLGTAPAGAIAAARGPAFLRGLLTNVLNPKVGLFYLSFLPQFVPAGTAAAPFMVLLTAIHVGLGLAWFGSLIAGLGALQRLLARDSVLLWLDRVAGGVFVAFGLKLALDRA